MGLAKHTQEAWTGARMGCHAQIAAAPASCTAAKANSASQTNIRIGQMNIDNTARATRKYSICETMKDGGWRYVVRNWDTKETILVPQDVSPEEFRDRLNLRAVLALVERVKELEGEFCLRITPRP
jgi:hypothetical protein